MPRSEAALTDVRIIGIFAHVDAGKTTTSEAILYHTGRIHRAGAVDDGTTRMDFMPQERERGITIMSAATACHWLGRRINLIDTPGHIDFTAEVVRSMRVIDGAVVILCAVGGVEPQTETVWMYANRENLARVLYINKLDRLGADYQRVLGEVRERLTPNALPVQIPIGQEEHFVGVVDLIDRRALVWLDGEDDPVEQPIPADLAPEVERARSSMVDSICLTDESLLNSCLEGFEPDSAELKDALRRATVAGELVPVLYGASRNRIGVQPLLDAVVAYLPAPVDMPPVMGVVPSRPGECEPGQEEIIERPDDPSAPMCATAFKIVTDPHVGHLTWVRVFSGKLNVRDAVYNPRADVQERVGRIYRMHGQGRELTDHLAAGDVVALVGVKSAVTGDTLCDPDHPILLETFKFPDPVITIALAPATTEERDRLALAVARLSSEDPTLVHQLNPETGELTLAGMGELHLDVTVDRLRTEFGITPVVSPPQVAYRETVRKAAEATGRYRKQSGGRGHFGEVHLRIEPLEAGQGILFENQAPAAYFPAEFVRPTETGVRQALAKGVIAGYPLTDARVLLLDGRTHEVDSAAADFEIAGSMGVRQAVQNGLPALLEPIMTVDLNVAEEHVGAIVGDLGRRRGVITSMRVRGTVRNLSGQVPLAETFGYATALRSMTAGRGAFTLEFDRYDLVPEPQAEAIIRRRRAEGKLFQR
jgi:elongation factor G